MKPYLVDVPVRINIWIRTECQRRQFEVIKKARPSILFLISDGGRNSQESEAISSNRKLFDEGIDWECTVYKLYETKNQGMYTMSRKGLDLVWSKVDRCIFLEDDILPSLSFFQYCAELLEVYKDDLRIHMICGMNHLGKSENVQSDYFFSRQGSIWGTAMWRRTQLMYDDFDYSKDQYIMGLLNKILKYNRMFRKRLNAYAKQKYYEGHVAGGEFFHEFAMYGQHQLQIIPKVNLISNIGCTASSAHSDIINQLPRGLRRVFNMETYEMEFPMKHAKYVISDIEYEKKRNRIMGYNKPIISTYRKFERLILKLLAGDISYISNIIKRKYNIEK